MRKVAASAVALLCLLACGGRSPDVPGSSCLEGPAPAPDGAWVRAIRHDPEAGSVALALAEGRTLTVPVDPQAVVSTLPGLTDAMLHLGAGDRLVGVTKHCDLPARLEDLPRVSVMPLDREVLLSLQPDLVLVDGVLLPEAERELGRHGLPVLPLQSRSLAHLRTSMDVLAAVLGTSEAKERAVLFGRRLDRAVDAANPRAALSLPPLRVLVVAQSDPLFVLGPGSLVDDMVRVCGGVNVACDLGRASGPFSEELVIARRPEAILVLDGELPPGVVSRWRGLPALTEDRVSTLEDDFVLRAGPQTPEALELLTEALHGAPPGGAGR